MLICMSECMYSTGSFMMSFVLWNRLDLIGRPFHSCMSLFNNRVNHTQEHVNVHTEDRVKNSHHCYKVEINPCLSQTHKILALIHSQMYNDSINSLAVTLAVCSCIVHAGPYNMNPLLTE